MLELINLSSCVRLLVASSVAAHRERTRGMRKRACISHRVNNFPFCCGFALVRPRNRGTRSTTNNSNKKMRPILMCSFTKMCIKQTGGEDARVESGERAGRHCRVGSVGTHTHTRTHGCKRKINYIICVCTRGPVSGAHIIRTLK